MKKALQLLAVVKVMSMLLIATMTVVIQGCQKEDIPGKNLGFDTANFQIDGISSNIRQIISVSENQTTRASDQKLNNDALIAIDFSGDQSEIKIVTQDGETVPAYDIHIKDINKNIFNLLFAYDDVFYTTSHPEGEIRETWGNFFVRKSDGKFIKVPDEFGLIDDRQIFSSADKYGNAYIFTGNGLMRVNITGEEMDYQEIPFSDSFQIDFNGNIYSEKGNNSATNNDVQYVITTYAGKEFIIDVPEIYTQGSICAVPFKDEKGGFLLLTFNTCFYIEVNENLTELTLLELPNTFDISTVPYPIGRNLVYNKDGYIRPQGYEEQITISENLNINEQKSFVVMNSDFDITNIAFNNDGIYERYNITTENHSYWVSNDYSIYDYSANDGVVTKLFQADQSMTISFQEPYFLDNFVRFFVEQGGKKYVYIIQDGILSTYGETDEKYSYYANMTSLVAM